jgi:twitching motility protein PilU
MAKSNRLGMKTFDQALYDLFEAGTISYEEALRNADSKNEIRSSDQAREQATRQVLSRRDGKLQIVEEDDKGKHFGS